MIKTDLNGLGLKSNGVPINSEVVTEIVPHDPRGKDYIDCDLFTYASELAYLEKVQGKNIGHIPIEGFPNNIRIQLNDPNNPIPMANDAAFTGLNVIQAPTIFMNEVVKLIFENIEYEELDENQQPILVKKLQGKNTIWFP